MGFADQLAGFLPRAKTPEGAQLKVRVGQAFMVAGVFKRSVLIGGFGIVCTWWGLRQAREMREAGIDAGN